MSVTYVTIQFSRGFVPTLLNFRFFRCGTISFVLTEVELRSSCGKRIIICLNFTGGNLAESCEEVG